MQQFLMDYSSGLSDDRDTHYCPQAGPEDSPGQGMTCRAGGHRGLYAIMRPLRSILVLAQSLLK